jgi:hypothetical protein
MTLADVIARCRKTAVTSEYLIHYTATRTGMVPGAPVRLTAKSAAFARTGKQTGILDQEHRLTTKSGAYRRGCVTNGGMSIRRRYSAICRIRRLKPVRMRSGLNRVG